MNHFHNVLSVFIIILFSFCNFIYSDETAELGRKVFQQYASSVITVKANLLITTSDSEEETVGQCTAVLVTPSGVAVLALSALDPSILLDQEMRNSVNIRIASIKMIFKEDKEIIAEVLLQDKERDIMIIRAKEAIPEDVAKVPLNKENISVPQVLDPLLLIMQHGKIARRSHSVAILRVESVIEKPFLFYTLNQSRSFEVLSSPLFSLDGKFVGIGTLRVVQEWKDETESNSLIIVLPAEQVIPLVNEALNQKPKEEGSSSNPTIETKQ
ncbi:MAG TPA: hypothetical protein PLT82_01795 [Candidatus Hydrogenedens sp.]|nr:hypothetical protein [Candidatus Hydrogenedens sp.]HPP57843.1 hypothetical protein [Candidatus Hydrogenedens sp.]